MTAASPFESHLQPGESLVWSAPVSAALRNAELTRHRLIYGLGGAASLIVTILLAVRFVESLLLVTAQPSMLAAITPLYAVFAIAMGILGVSLLLKTRRKPPPAAHYGATSARLLALDATGAIIDELTAAEVETILAGGRRKTPDVYVLRRNDPQDTRVFAIEHIDKPLEAKAILEDMFLHTQPAQTQPALSEPTS